MFLLRLRSYLQIRERNALFGEAVGQSSFRETKLMCAPLVVSFPRICKLMESEDNLAQVWKCRSFKSSWRSSVARVANKKQFSIDNTYWIVEFFRKHRRLCSVKIICQNVYLNKDKYLKFSASFLLITFLKIQVCINIHSPRLKYYKFRSVCCDNSRREVQKEKKYTRD